MSLAPSTLSADPQWAVTRHLLEIQRAVLSRASLSSIIERYNLYPDERRKLPLADVILLMRDRDLRIQPATAAGESAFSVEFAYRNPAAAQAAVHALVSSLLEQNLQVSRRPGVGVTNIEVLNPASLPRSPPVPIVSACSATDWVQVCCWACLRPNLVGRAKPETPDLSAHRQLRVRRYSNRNTLRTTIEHALSDDSLAAIVRRDGLFPRENEPWQHP